MEHTRTTRRIVGSLVVVGALVLAGCSSSDDADEGDDAAVTTTATDDGGDNTVDTDTTADTTADTDDDTATSTTVGDADDDATDDAGTVASGDDEGSASGEDDGDGTTGDPGTTADVTVPGGTTRFAACEALDVAFVTEVAAASGLPPADWEEQPNPDTADRCAWYNPAEMYTLNLEVYAAGIFDISEQADREGLEAREVPGLDGALAVYDTFGETTFQIWAPLPDGTTMLFMQVLLKFDVDSMNEMAITAYENLTGETVDR